MGYSSGPEFTVLEGAGDGTFPRARSVAIPEDSAAVTVVDLDGKIRPDLILEDSMPAVMLARAGGSFSKPRELPVGDEGCGSRRSPPET